MGVEVSTFGPSAVLRAGLGAKQNGIKSERNAGLNIKGRRLSGP